MAKKNEISLDELKREIAAETAEMVDNSAIHQIIVFKLAGEEYGLPIDQIKEVVLTPRIAQVPQTPEYIHGVANIRGNLIGIMDLAAKFNLGSDSQSGTADAHYTLVIESEDFKIGILVKEVPNTLAVKESAIDQSSDIIRFSSIDDECITGIVKEEDRMIILLDMFKMMESKEVVSYAAASNF